jgi:RNAse (barnase) inhibitor barstar
MAWEVAVILNPDCDVSTAATLATYMPLWIADTPTNQASISAARRVGGDLWGPEPSCTSFNFFAGLTAEENFANIVDAVLLHHPSIAKWNILGLENTNSLRSYMGDIGFLPAKATWDETLAFRKPVANINNVPHLTLDAKKWRTSNDVYDDLFHVLGAPPWHSKNFDALHDSIVTGQINAVEVPYVLSIRGINSAKSEARLFVKDLANLISRFESEGCPVSIHIDD